MTFQLPARFEVAIPIAGRAAMWTDQFAFDNRGRVLSLLNISCVPPRYR
jgi:hypothetical protein